MSQISKKKKNTVVASGLAAVAITGMSVVSSAKADVYEEAVKRASMLGGSDVIAGASTSASDQATINTINSQIRNLASTSSFITINGTVDVPSNINVSSLTSELSTIQDLVNQAATLSADIKSQTANYLELTGIQSASAGTVSVDVSTDYASTITQLKDAISKMTELRDANKTSLASLASNSSDVLAKEVKKANEIITNASKNVDYNTSGATGNYADIKRAAEDSAKASGVVVDTSKTNQVNAVTDQGKQTITTVASVDEVNSELTKILAEISANNTANQSSIGDSSTYKANSLQNIADINAWLQKEKDRAANIQSEIAKNSSALSNMDSYKTSNLAKLNEIKTYIQNEAKGSDTTKQKLIAKIDEAIANLNSSGITVNVTDTINAADNIDFGNIGRPNSEVKELENAASAKIDSAIATAMEKLASSNTASTASIQPTVDKNQKQIDDFVAKVKKGGVGTQIDKSWLESRKIYNSGTAAYKDYITKAIDQTQEAVDSVITGTKEHGDVVVKTVAPNTSAATASAAEYQAQSANGFDNGFGSPMVPSSNINDFVKVVGDKFGDSQRMGGASAVLSKLKEVYSDPDNFDSLPVVKDIRSQHINVVGDSNVYLIVTEKPVATFLMKDTFAYTNGEQVTKTTDMLLTTKLTDIDGNSLTNKLQTSAPGNLKYGNKPYYLYYMSVDPNTGQVVTGGGYIRTGGAGITDGNNGNSGVGEMGLSDETPTGLNDSTHLENLSGRVLTATRDDVNRLASNGLILGFDLSVRSDAGEWAKNAPLYVSDIDDGQALYVNNGTKLDIIMGSTGDISVEQKGNISKISTSDLGKSTGANGTTNLDTQSVLIFGSDKDPGLVQQYGGIGHEGFYGSIDVSLFAPFGVIGAPNIKVDAVNAAIDTFKLSDPSAVAHTEASTNINNSVRYLRSVDGDNFKTVNDYNIALALKTLQGTSTEDKKVSSSTTLIVRKLVDDLKRTASSNSLVVRNPTTEKRTSSANTLLIKELANNVRTSSANTLTVRTIDKESRTASGASLVVKVVENTGKSISSDGSVVTTNPVSPTITTVSNDKALTLDSNKSDTAISTKQLVKMTVYVDPSLADVAKQSFNAWDEALNHNNVDLDVTFTSDINDLKNGVSLAILDSDVATTRLDVAEASVGIDSDSEFEFSKLAGLSMTTSKITLVDADSNDKYNRSGTIKEGDALKNTKFIIQVNTESLQSLDNAEHVIRHELGHIFGLGHKSDDSLMTPYYSNKVFTGAVSDWASANAATNIINSDSFNKSIEPCSCAICGANLIKQM